MEIPLHLIAEKLTLVDTNDINIANSSNIDINNIYISIENGFPVEGEIQLILLNKENMIIDTLLQKSTILAATVNENLQVDQSTTSIFEIDYTDFTNVSRLITTTSFSTKPINEFIKIYSDYNIEIKISAQISKRVK